MTIIDDLKATVRISELAANYGDVKRRGRLHVCRCLCGENSDRNPSFTLYDDDNHFHCFACQRHGSVIDLVMLTEGLDFKAAVERLRRQYRLGHGHVHPTRGVQRPASPGIEYELTSDVLALMAAATSHYQSALRRAPAAMRYLHARGLNDGTINRLRIGYADGALGRALFAQGLDLALVAEIGLLTPRGERMHGRVVFPVLDERDRAVWMMGRALDDASQPKYLGLPDGLVHKQPMVLGTPKRGAIWVEGAFDVAALVQWGLDADYLLVGLLGTAHSQALAVVCKRAQSCPVFVALDQDAAGDQASISLMTTLHAMNASRPAIRMRWHDVKDCGSLLVLGEAGRARFVESLRPP